MASQPQWELYQDLTFRQENLKLFYFKIHSKLGRVALFNVLYYKTMENGKKYEYSLDEIFYRTVNNNLAKVREKKKKSQDKISQLVLADKADVSRNYVGMVERDEIHPGLLNVLKMLIMMDEDPVKFVDDLIKETNLTKKTIELENMRKNTR